MKLNQPLESYSDEQLREMLAEALRAKKLLEDNPDAVLTTHTGYCLDGDEILTLETTMEHDFATLELSEIIALINHVLTPSDDESDA